MSDSIIRIKPTKQCLTASPLNSFCDVLDSFQPTKYVYGLLHTYMDIIFRVQLASLALSEPRVKRAHLGFWENLEVLDARGSLETLDLLVALETKVNQERTDCQYVIPYYSNLHFCRMVFGLSFI